MYHNMLYAGKTLLYRVMYMFRNFVCIAQRCISVRANFNIYINAIAKNSCAQEVDPKYALDRKSVV